MAKVFVFCIGGTGLRVMKSVVMMAAAGMRTNGYDIVPIGDTFVIAMNIYSNKITAKFDLFFLTNNKKYVKI